MNRQVHYCFSLMFKEYQKSPIFQSVYEILNGLVQENFENQKAIIERLWRLECEQISTLNEDYQIFMANHHEKLSERRKRNLEDQRSRAAANAVGGANPDEDNNPGSTPSPRKKRNPAGPLPSSMLESSPDPYRKEIEVLAQVRAYSEVAQKRFVDNVYMSIQGELVNGFRQGLHEALQNGLGLNGPDGMFASPLPSTPPLGLAERKKSQSYARNCWWRIRRRKRGGKSWWLKRSSWIELWNYFVGSDLSSLSFLFTTFKLGYGFLAVSFFFLFF